MPGMLYYPLINAPCPVIAQAVLYWDHLSTLVPDRPDPSLLNPVMREVDDAGLYRPVYPRRLDLEREALDALSALARTLPADDLLPAGPTSRLFPEKLPFIVLNELQNRGLIRVDPGPGVPRVSPAIQLCLLSIAARKAAERAAGGCFADTALVPYTDAASAHRLAFEPVPHQRERPCLTVDIGGLLPSPRGDVPLHRLLEFRQKYDDERRALLIKIHEATHRFQQSFEHPADVFHSVRRELEQAVADLEAAGRSKRIDWVQRSVALSIGMASGFGAWKAPDETRWVLGVIGGYAINVATGSSRTSAKHAVDWNYLHRLSGLR